jgi:hypothetical protein
MATTAIQPYEGEYLTGWRNPEQVLAEAQQAATALTKVIGMKKKPIVFNGETYLEKEDWGTVAKFYGCTAKTVSTDPCEYNGAKGWEAVAVVIDRNGLEVGRAEAMCLDDEENWGAVPKYEWQDVLGPEGKKIWDKNLFGGKGAYVKQKVQVGVQHKPQFQLRSMAQTRATAKALRDVFSWVVVLAGYRPTPAEEIVQELGRTEPAGRNKPPVQEPRRASETQAKPSEAANPKVFEGAIKEAKTSAAGSLWMVVDGVGLVRVHADKIDADMKVGHEIKFMGLAKNAPNVGNFTELTALMELNPPPSNEPAVEDEPPLFSDEPEPSEGNAVIEDMKASGALKPASEVEVKPKVRKVIGKNRAQRLYAMLGANKDNNGGMTDADLHHILSFLPNPVEHLSDLEIGLESTIERFVTGAEDWKAWLESPE